MENIRDNDLQFPNLKMDDNVLILYLIDLEQKSLQEGLEDLKDCIVSSYRALTSGENNLVSPNRDIGDTIKYNIANTALVLNSRKEVVEVRDKILVRIEDIIYKAISKQILNNFRTVDSVNMDIHICERLPKDFYDYNVYKPYTNDCLDEWLAWYEICEPLEFVSTSVSALVLQLEVLKKYYSITEFIRVINGLDYQIYVDNIRVSYMDGLIVIYDEIERFLKDFFGGGQDENRKQKWYY